MRIIGICGAKRSGKDTVAEILTEKLEAMGKSVRRFAFADAIRQAATAVCTWEELTTDLKDKRFPVLGITPRDVMVAFGQSLRALNPNIWINLLSLRLWSYVEDGLDYAIITDVRQLNEIKWLLGLQDSILLHVSRPGCKENPDDCNERPMIEIDIATQDDRELLQQVVFIHNNFGLDRLKDEVAIFCENFQLED